PHPGHSPAGRQPQVLPAAKAVTTGIIDHELAKPLECVRLALLLTRIFARIGASSGRSAMFIAQPPSGCVKLRRSGMTRLQSGSPRLPVALHAAPTELEDTFVRLRCYKHGAPNGAS